MSVNEHTGDKQKTGVPSEEYRNNYDLIFKKKPKTTGEVHERKAKEREWLAEIQRECNTD